MKTETELMQAADEDYEAQKQKVIEAEEEHKRKMEELCSIAGDCQSKRSQNPCAPACLGSVASFEGF
jgi:hypothetical protein